MAKNEIYTVLLRSVINPSYGFGYTLPYLAGSVRVALLSPTLIPVTDTSFVQVTTEIKEVMAGTYAMTPILGDQNYATWLNVTGTARYVRVYLNADTDVIDPYVVDIDMEEDIYLDDDTFSVYFGVGFLTFSGNFI